MTEMEKQLLKQNNALQKEISLLNEQVRLLTQKLFGRSSEASKKDDSDEDQLSLFDDTALNTINADPLAEEAPTPAETEEITYTRKKQKGHRARLIKDLETETVVSQLTGVDCECDWCRTELRPIGTTHVRTEVKMIPARLKKVEYHTTAYECPSCKADGSDAIHKAPTPKPVIQNSLASPSAISWLMHQKFEMSLPYYRQEKEWAAYGLEVSRATLANWTIRATQSWLAPLYEMMHQRLMADSHIHADETTTQVLREDGRKPTAKSYMWLFQTGKYSHTPIILYHYAPTRSAKISKAFLKDFTGYLHCDGYEGYNHVTDITRVGCWAHARRKFEEARVATSTVPSEKKSHSEIGLDYCNQLFKWEREWSALTPADRYVKRQTYAAPLLKQFWTWVDAVHALPASKLGKALSYAKNQKDFLMNYLSDGICEISNNAAERSIRPFVVGRKNWYFSSSVKGAQASAMAYSFIETAKANGLNVQKYLTYLFETLPNIAFDEEPDRLSAYLPWAKHIQAHCQ